MESAMTNRLGLLALTAVAGLTTPAAAQEWDGALAGVTAGYAWSEDQASAISILALPVGPPIVDRLSGDGATLGAMAGYRWDLGGLVAGAELDAEWSDANMSRNTPAASSATQIKWQGSIRAVVGVPAGRALIFATGGIGTGRIEHSANFGLGAPAYRWSHSPRAWVAGGGVELDLGKIRPRIEYRHTDYRRTQSDPSAPIIFFRKVSANSVRLSALVAF
jgi:outer membrane immunogenic protein